MYVQTSMQISVVIVKGGYSAMVCCNDICIWGNIKGKYLELSLDFERFFNRKRLKATASQIHICIFVVRVGEQLKIVFMNFMEMTFLLSMKGSHFIYEINFVSSLASFFF